MTEGNITSLDNTASYKYVSKTPNNKFIYPGDITADSSGYIYVADTSNHQIQKFAADGIIIAKWGSRGTNDGEFQNPQSVAVDSSGNVYVADTNNNRIQKFAKTSDTVYEFEKAWGSSGSGDGQFQAPYGVAVDPSSGNVYVVDTLNNRVQKFDTDGGFITKWGSAGIGDGQFDKPYGVAVGSSGNIYVTDTYNHCIQKFVLAFN